MNFGMAKKKSYDKKTDQYILCQIKYKYILYCNNEYWTKYLISQEVFMVIFDIWVGDNENNILDILLYLIYIYI